MREEREHEPLIWWNEHHQKWSVSMPGISSIWCDTEEQAHLVAATSVPEQMAEHEQQWSRSVADAEHLAQVESADRAGWEARARRAELRLAEIERAGDAELFGPSKVDPGWFGAIRVGPQGHGVVNVNQNVEKPWLMLPMRGDQQDWFTDDEVATWPVVGAVPGTIAESQCLGISHERRARQWFELQGLEFPGDES